MKKKVALSLCMLLLVTGCGKIPTLSNGEEIVAQVNGKDFTANELYESLKGKAGSSMLLGMVDDFIAKSEVEDPKDAEVQAQNQIDYIKQQYKDYEMDFQQALKDNGYASEKTLFEEFTREYLKEQAITKFMQSQLTEKEINDYYEKEIFGEMTVRHILIQSALPDGKTEENATEEEIATASKNALAKANDIIKKIKAGQKFEDAAKEFSDDGSSKDGGLISNFTKDGVVPEFWDASMKLKDGEMTNTPVKSKFGYHIIIRVSQKAKPTKEKVLEKMKETLVNNKIEADEQAASKAWIELRKKYKFNIIDSVLEKSYKNTIDSINNAKSEQ